MKLDVTKQFSARSDRVKGIDFHPTEKWVLTTMYNGKVEIWSYATNSVVRSIQVTELPVRAGKFIARKNWIVVGSDDFYIRVYNYNTGEKVAQFEAHPDYIRSIAVHPSKPFALTTSDDMTIKLWNWDNNWRLEQTYEGHQHYVMNAMFNPKDPNAFASASLDRTIKIWSLGSLQPNFTLVAHDVKGVNYVDYYPQADKPYLISCSDDKTIKVWDYQTKACIAVLEGHLSNVSFAVFHPELPLIVSGSEDGTIRFWNANTFKLEQSMNYGLERVWCASLLQKSNLVSVGCDSGYVIVKVGNEEPLFSMDANNKLLYAKNSEVFQSVIKPSATEALKDGEGLSLQQRELGTVEIYPQSLAHSPNGRYAAVCGDGEYIVYTALAWRSKAYGSALDFCWNTMDFTNNCQFAVRETPLSVKVKKNFQDHLTLDLIYQADKIYGGALLGVKLEGCISFYDWVHGNLVRRVDLDDEIEDVCWSDNGELLAIVTTLGSQADSSGSKKNDEVYFLSYDAQVFEEAVVNDSVDPEEGVEDAFEVLYTLPTSEPVLSGKFIGDVFVYMTANSNRLNYFVGGEVINLGHFDHKYYLIGYKASDGKLFLIDKSFTVVSWYINSQVLELQTLVMRGELEQFSNQKILDENDEEIPDVSKITLDDLHSTEYGTTISSLTKTELNQLSRFFEKLGYIALSYQLSQDFDSKFQIATSSGNLLQAVELLATYQNENPSSEALNSSKWQKLANLALSKWKVKLALECFWKANDFSSLLLLLSSCNDRAGLQKLSVSCQEKGKYNIAWQAAWLAEDIEKCLELLVASGKLPEAAFFGVNYNANKRDVADVVAKWKSKLNDDQKGRISDRLLDDFIRLDINGSADHGTVKSDSQKTTQSTEVPIEIVDELPEDTNEELHGELSEPIEKSEEDFEVPTDEALEDDVAEKSFNGQTANDLIDLDPEFEMDDDYNRSLYQDENGDSLI